MGEEGVEDGRSEEQESGGKWGRWGQMHSSPGRRSD